VLIFLPFTYLDIRTHVSGGETWRATFVILEFREGGNNRKDVNRENYSLGRRS
jgi:hypothetical protein